MKVSILEFKTICKELNINSFNYQTRYQTNGRNKSFAADIELKDMFVSAHPNIISFSSGKSRFTFWCVKRVYIKYNIRHSRIVVMIECLGQSSELERYVLTKDIHSDRLGKYAPELLPAECDVVKLIISKYPNINNSKQ